MSRSTADPTASSPDAGFLWRICLIAAMGGLLFGYDWVVIGGAKPFYEAHFGIGGAPFLQGLCMSSALLGCLVGAAVAGVVSDRFGRRGPLIAAGILFTATGVGTALAWDLTSFNLARWIGGVGIGLASNVSPMYIAEVSPAGARGRFVSINQLTIVIGILAAQVVNLLIAAPVPAGTADAALAASWNGQLGWRWMFAAEAVPSVLFLALMFAVPESPRWLVTAGQLERARQVLARVGGPAYAEAELADIRSTISRDEIGRMRLRDLNEPGLRRVLVLGVALAVFQQWCGINVIFNYAQEVFKAAGYEVGEMLISIVITGVVNLVFTFVAIATVDRWGRRPLMLFGAGSLAAIYGLLGAGYLVGSRGPHMLALVVAAIACYAMSLAPVTWVVIAEIFPNRIRGAAMSVAVFALWLACSVLTFTFPFLNTHLGPHGTFWLYGAICAAGFAFMARQLPETKGKTLEEIERQLGVDRG
ncbi:sugar porter family MFS transporter [Aquisphaera insulae]|uniref:sugar porter family MFS transporter n=1 Tax=Aquisphaera insulae TaxID=2712864 RepID=UPI0013ECA339|nr:sugar porter family MFS transporter [Aquisphaera insulae]